MMFSALTPYLGMIRLAGMAALAGVLIAGGCQYGQKRILGQWERAKAAEAEIDRQAAQALAEANAAAKAAQDAATALNRRVILELEPKLAAADSRGRDLARLLLAANANRATDAIVSEASNQRLAAEASRITASLGSVETALGTALGACERDGLRLDALIAEITPQL